jgi:hypothetical protein
MKTVQNIDYSQGEGYINIVKGNTLMCRVPFSDTEKHIIGDMNREEAQIFADKIKFLIDNE